MVDEARTCPSCKVRTLIIRRWKQSALLSGEIRECPDRFGCGFTSNWTVDLDSGMATGVFLKPIHRAQEPVVTVPGGTA